MIRGRYDTGATDSKRSTTIHLGQKAQARKTAR
jgi:hypothetical protein